MAALGLLRVGKAPGIGSSLPALLLWKAGPMVGQVRSDISSQARPPTLPSASSPQHRAVWLIP